MFWNSNMVWFNFLILIPLIAATRRFDGPSFRSGKIEGDKPILRMDTPNADYAESNSDEVTQTSPPPKTKDPTLARDLGLLVNWLVENFSYDVGPLLRKNNNGVMQTGKPILRMPHNDTIDSESDEDDVKVAPEIEITESRLPISENPVQPPVEPSEESEDSGGALRTKHKTKKKQEKEPNPEWVKNLKEFIKDLTTRHGQHEVLQRAKPIIASLEKRHKMKIEDIDGEIHITYKDKDKKTARKRKKSDET